jgi:hypothetical protein
MVDKSSAVNFLNGRFTRFFIDTSATGSTPGMGSSADWTIIGGDLTGKWTIDPQLEDYTTKDSDAIVYYPTRYKWNGSFDTNYLDDDPGQQWIRAVALSVGQGTSISPAHGPVCRIAWRIQENITGGAPASGVPKNQAHMVGMAAFKCDFDMTDAKMGKMTVTFTGSGAIDLSDASDPGAG